MVLQVALLLKTFPTDITLVWLLSCVDFTMASQAVIVTELLATDLTVVSAILSISTDTCVRTKARCCRGLSP